MTRSDSALQASTRTSSYQQDLPGLGQLRLVRIAPDDDAPLLHSWVSEERARYWGMGSLGEEEVREIYQFLDGLVTHHGYLILVADQPAGIFQTYEPEHDPVGEAYPVHAGDAGIHLLLAPAAQPVPGFTAAVLSALLAFVFADSTVRRVVAEPDARNSKAVARFLSFGFEPDARVQLAEKEAQLVFLTRQVFEAQEEDQPGWARAGRVGQSG
ncbi:Aminoglycoside N(6')-acetyltransferase type 1 [Arthrobacter ulcerisalmonis]|uniref:Lysine N-acyltransferase MbtK n=1 Tax=Arthrobacter ulcerisalmonis TaxID=2483813 RepID=A0A3P5WH16_9MICC|nr:GNAT family N-acetyltransferase [Arthrobacter ulcerisalmonis]VDC20958.1 Aminoglycoside N(6')-acetyltransferase type 1 [Arthrobacter ulcerisalmonis]